jgi:hypothetical protein
VGYRKSAPNCDCVVGGCGSPSRITGSRRICLHQGRVGFGSGRLSPASRSSVAVFAHAEADQKQRGDYTQEDKAHRHLGAHDLHALAFERPVQRVTGCSFASIALLVRHPTRHVYYTVDNICQIARQRAKVRTLPYLRPDRTAERSMGFKKACWPCGSGRPRRPSCELIVEVIGASRTDPSRQPISLLMDRRCDHLFRIGGNWAPLGLRIRAVRRPVPCHDFMETHSA